LYDLVISVDVHEDVVLVEVSLEPIKNSASDSWFLLDDWPINYDDLIRNRRTRSCPAPYSKLFQSGRV